MNATATQDKIASILSAAQVSYAVTYCGQTKRDNWECDAWRVRLANGKQIMETDYFTGLGLRSKKVHFVASKPVAPKSADVLHSLTLDSTAGDQSFFDWCAEYGYSDDSLKALDTYRACCKIAQDLRRIFKPETLAAIREALQDY